ncbi:hypothetical protein [Undibacterium sp. TS12]|uniref:hypothetical protein n=1 Tax=Undibacterium sp. TS12 TaxID=2908202 RepID=UPI001F4CCCCD|nr:hypothetical protein [Undibacterium sp. TS12]MCH8618903.1 hypothetical protein [Undibacterium sp. TS12]
MELHQLQTSYLPDQDRLLVKFSFAEKSSDGAPSGRQEIHLLFTRRTSMKFWPALLEAMTKQVRMSKPGAAHASSEIVQMEHEASLAAMQEGGVFNKPYESNVDGWPLGKDALLPVDIQFHVHATAPFRMEFVVDGGKNFEVAMGSRLLHGFCKLFQDAVEKADWGFTLEMTSSTPEAPPAHLLN